MVNNKKYYYSHILNDNEKKICGLIVDTLRKRKKILDINYIAVDNKTIFKIIDVILLDFPEFFFLNGSSTKICQFGFKVRINFEYYYTLKEINALEKQINNKTDLIIKSIPTNFSLPQKEKLLHDYLIKNTIYAIGNLSDPKLHNIVGSLMEGVAVCEGYAKTYQYLCEKIGILCLMVTGSSKSRFNQETNSHAWNIVRVYSKGCCHVDVTWDSCLYHEGAPYYVYYNQPDQEMILDHSWDADRVPKCNNILTSPIHTCNTPKQLEEFICNNIMNNVLEFSVKVNKDFSGNEEVLALTRKMLLKHSDLLIQKFTVSYIKERNQIEYRFERFF